MGRARRCDAARPRCPESGAASLFLERAGTVGHPRGPWQVFPQRPDTSGAGGTSDEAEVIAPGTDEQLFASLHGVLAQDGPYDEVAARIAGDDGYAGIVDTLRATARSIPMRCGWCTRGRSIA